MYNLMYNLKFGCLGISGKKSKENKLVSYCFVLANIKIFLKATVCF